MATKFTLFPQLITELRLEIWQLALPPPIRRPLYPYQKEGWTYTFSGSEFDPHGPDLHIIFDTSQIEPLHICLPLYSVNREARSVAIKYIENQKLLPPRHNPKSGNFECLRRFDPQTDTLYLPTPNVDVFVSDLINRTFAEDLQDRIRISGYYPILERVAMTPAGFEALKGDALQEVYEFGGPIDIIYIVDTGHTSEATLRELEETGTVLNLEDAPCAGLEWRRSQSGWEAFGDDKGALQLKRLVEGCYEPSYTSREYGLKVQLVRLT